MLMMIDWNSVLLYGVPAYIAALGGAIAAVIAAKNQRSLRTTNGKTIAQSVEETHAAVTDQQAQPEPSGA